MSPSEELLEQAAQNGTFDSAEWPRVLETVLERIDHIAHNEFPIPPVVLPQVIYPPASPPARPQPEESVTSSTAAQPSETSVTQIDPPSSPPNPQDALQQPPESEQVKATAVSLPPGTLPAPLHAILIYIKSTLSTNFPSRPPHTIQRLAELVLYPKQHYRLLHKYLNALHRVVSVSSDCTIYPLPTLDLPGGILVNGTGHVAPSSQSHHDDSLGGALLTPIPWLANGASRSRSASLASLDQGHTTNGASEGQGATFTNEDGDTSMTMEEQLRENGGVTQGELLRQEQEASDPPAPVGSLANRDHVIAAASAPTTNATEETKEAAEDAEAGDQPHARGPTGIGAEDIGNQEHAVGLGQVLDLQAAVGRAPEPGTVRSPEGEQDHGEQHKPADANEEDAAKDGAESAVQARGDEQDKNQDTQQREEELQEDVSMTG